MLDPGEECDDTNDSEIDGCATACVWPRVVFATSRAVRGDLDPPLGTLHSGVALADAWCQTSAESAGLHGQFVAWLSSPTSSARDRLDRNFRGAYLTVAGDAVALDGWRDLTDGLLARPIDRDERGDLLDHPPLGTWTATTAEGTRGDLAPHCQGWTSRAYAEEGSFGLAYDAAWTDGAIVSCSSIMRLLCFQNTPAAQPFFLLPDGGGT